MTGWIKTSKYIKTQQISKILTLDEFLSSETQLQKYVLKRKRWRLFRAKGYRCTDCQLEGTHVIIWYEAKVSMLHTDLVALVDVNNDTEYMLMTMDHIMPRAHGGSDAIDNMQPMCSHCNSKKGSPPPHRPLTESERLRQEYLIAKRTRHRMKRRVKQPSDKHRMGVYLTRMYANDKDVLDVLETYDEVKIYRNKDGNICNIQIPPDSKAWECIDLDM